MLLALRISNLAVIESVEVAFGPGLTVLTGETGAGKSILAGALGLLLGGRADADCVRGGADEAQVEAIFARTPNVAARLAELGLPDVGDEVCVRRILGRNGRTRASVNGALASAAFLGRLLKGEVDVASQHEHVALFDARAHLALLDKFCGLHAAAADHAAAFRALQKTQAQLRALGGGAPADRDQRELWTHHLKELEAVRPQPGEEAALDQERRRLASAERLRSGVGEALAMLGTEELDGARTQLGKAAQLVMDACRHDAELETVARGLASAQAEVEESIRELCRYLDKLALDPERLRAIEDRQDALRRLCRKHQTDVAGLCAKEGELREALLSIDRRAEQVQSLERDRARAEAAATATARALSEVRAEAAQRLSASVTSALAKLAMPAAAFSVQLEPRELGEDGADAACFLFAANAGEPPKPLNKVASGGESSRLLIALKRALLDSDPCGTCVLDEADAGVSGGTAEIVARMLKEISACRQVLCITHLPQVAAYADAHLVVHKSERHGRTRSGVQALATPEERALEVARMLSGVCVTPEARGAAHALIRAASSSGQRRPPAPRPGRRTRQTQVIARRH